MYKEGLYPLETIQDLFFQTLLVFLIIVISLGTYLVCFVNFK